MSKNMNGLEIERDVEVLEWHDSAAAEKRGTKHDDGDMNRMGKLPQLRRTFRFISMFGYGVVLGATWEFALVSLGFSLTNGGTAGGIWMFLVVCVGMFFVVLSLAEMASMAPTAGGQYHWVSEFAPPKYQKFLSYLVGWFAVIGWQAAMAAGSFACAQQLEGLIALNIESYVIKGWHGTLLTIAVVAFSLFWNTILVRKLPLLEDIIVILHILGFVVFVVVLWTMSPRSDAKTVWTDFQDNGNWGSIGLSCLVGLTGPLLTLIGADSACHLSEELRDASWVLPRSMVVTAIVNYSLGFVMTITIMSTLGDVNGIFDTTTGQPYIQVVLNATESRIGTSFLTAIVAVILLFSSVNLVTTSSRQLFAFARDKGLPFSEILAHVRPGWDIPVNTILATFCSSSLLSLIIIGSTIGFNIIVSIGLVGNLAAYLVAIACVARKRIVNEPLLPSRFDLGRAGLPINAIALSSLAVFLVFPFFPAVSHPHPVEMNWNIVITGCIILGALVYYFLTARHEYRGPVEYVKQISY